MGCSTIKAKVVHQNYHSSHWRSKSKIILYQLYNCSSTVEKERLYDLVCFIKKHILPTYRSDTIQCRPWSWGVPYQAHTSNGLIWIILFFLERYVKKSLDVRFGFFDFCFLWPKNEWFTPKGSKITLLDLMQKETKIKKSERNIPRVFAISFKEKKNYSNRTTRSMRLVGVVQGRHINVSGPVLSY